MRLPIDLKKIFFLNKPFFIIIFLNLGDQVNWIQCESLDCSKWYHMVCVGQTVKTAQQIPTYICYQCSNLNMSTSEQSDLISTAIKITNKIEILN